MTTKFFDVTVKTQLVVLTVLLCLSIFSRSAFCAAKSTPSLPPKSQQIEKLSVASLRQGEKLTITFTGAVLPQQILIGGKPAAFVEQPKAATKAITVRSAMDTPVGKHNVLVLKAKENAAKPSIKPQTISIISVKPTPQIDKISPSSTQAGASLQPGETLAITFTEGFLPQRVLVGGKAAAFIDRPVAPSKDIVVRLSLDTPMGDHDVVVEGRDSQTGKTLKIRPKVVWIMPLVTGIRSANSISKTLAENEIVAGQRADIQLSDNFPVYLAPLLGVKVDGVLVPAKPSGKTLQITIPAELSRGDHQVQVEVGSSVWQSRISAHVYPNPGQATVTDIMPRLLRPGTRMTITGQNLIAPADQVTVLVGGVAARVFNTDPAGTKIYAEVMSDERHLAKTPLGQQGDAESNGQQARNKILPGGDVEVRLWGMPVSLPTDFSVKIERSVGTRDTLLLIAAALGVVVAIAMLISWFYSFLAQGNRNWLEALLLEPETQTYSLSRAQFFWWSIIVSFGYIFLFVGRGFIEEKWEFPSLQGFGITFLISLGTLVLAQATSNAKGTKGAGSMHPSPADLVVHGGVLAPERVQQVAWTIITGTGFLVILIKTYAGRTQLPIIPDELLYLMGMSSVGYLAGKAVRKPGPNIKEVAVEDNANANGVRLKISGIQLGKNAVVLLDDNEQASDLVSMAESDPTSPEFANALFVNLPPDNRMHINSTKDWFGARRTITVRNGDMQHAEWWTAPAIVTVEPLNVDTATGQLALNVQTEHVDSDAHWEAEGANLISFVQQPDDHRMWLLTLQPGGSDGTTQPYDKLIVVNRDNHRGTFSRNAPLTPSNPTPPETTKGVDKVTVNQGANDGSDTTTVNTPDGPDDTTGDATGDASPDEGQARPSD